MTEKPEKEKPKEDAEKEEEEKQFKIDMITKPIITNETKVSTIEKPLLFFNFNTSISKYIYFLLIIYFLCCSVFYEKSQRN